MKRGIAKFDRADWMYYRRNTQMDITEAIHYLKVLQKYGCPFQWEIREALTVAIRNLSKSQRLKT